MTFRLTPLTPTIGAAPGERVLGRVEIHNDGSTNATYTIVVVGLDTGSLDGAAQGADVARVHVDAGQSAVCNVAVDVPRSLGIGEHAAAFEAVSDRPGDRAVLTPFTLSIASVSRVDLVAVPATIRARRRAGFDLDITNNEPQQVDVTVTGEAPDVDVQFTPSAFTLLPGQRAIAKGRLRGPRHWSGEQTQHNVLITARGRASSTSTTAQYVQRPLFAHRMRMLLVGLTVVAVWLAAIGGVAFWLASRDDGTDAAGAIVGIDTDGDGIVDTFRDADGNILTAIDTDGDGIPDQFLDADGNPVAGVDADGDGIPDSIVDQNGKPLKAIDTNGDGIPDALSDGSPLPAEDEVAASEPQATIVRGTVEIDGDPTEVAITLTPVELGSAPAPAAAPIGFRGAEANEATGKLWPARFGSLNDLTTSERRTVAIAPAGTTPGADGVWLFTDVLQGQSYEISFARAGYDTQSFVVTPTANGEPVELDIKMKAAKGALSGTVTGPAGALGGAEIVVTDGTLEFKTTSATNGGGWLLEGISTPGVYTISAKLRGYSTAVRQIELGPGDKPTGLSLQMQRGLGTMTGRVVDNAGRPVPGVTITASNGDTKLTSTSLTQGDIGFFSLPQLTVPATYTVTAELDGYITQTRRVPLNDSIGGIDFTLTSETISLTGRVTNAAGEGIATAGLIISTGDLQFRSSTAAAPAAGVFTIDRLPPGTYTITIEHYQYETATEFVTLEAGQAPPPLNVTLQRSTGPPKIGTGTLSVIVLDDDAKADPRGILGAEVTVSRNRSGEPPHTLTDPTSSGVTFKNLPIGTYTINVKKAGFNDSSPETKTIGFASEQATIEITKLGSAAGSMIDSLHPEVTLKNYTLELYKVRPGQSDAYIGDLTPNSVSGQWSTPENLSTGLYRIVAPEATMPPGYIVRSQVIDNAPEVGGQPMTFFVPAGTGEAVKPVVPPAIKADPYPTITGLISKPVLNGTAVNFVPFDDNDLAVTGTCNGQTVTVTVTNELGDASKKDAFSISKSEISRTIPPSALPGSCNVVVAAPGHTSAEYTFTSLTPSLGTTATDRRVAAALAAEHDAFTGSVFWMDTGADPDRARSLAGTSITTTTPVITGFTAKESTVPNVDPTPGWTTGVLTATSSTPVPPNDATPSTWTIAAPAFGPATYSFAAPNFGTGTVPAVVDQTGAKFPTGSHGNAVVTADGSAFKVQLTAPGTGTAKGKVTIETSTTPKYATVRALDAAGANLTTTPAAPSGDFSFAGAAAGTWTVSFDLPPNHKANVADPVTKLVAPGVTTEGFDASFTELGAIEVRLFDKSSSARITPDAGFGLTGFATSNRPVGAPTNLAPGGTPPDMGYRLASLPVAAIAPATSPVSYNLAMTATDFDLKHARVSINGGALVDLDARQIAGLGMLAGQTVKLDIYVEQYGSLTGTLYGRSGAPGESAAELPFDLPPGQISATMGVERVNADGSSYDPGPAPEPSARVVTAAGGKYTVIAPPGFYRLQPAHDEYQDTPSATPADPGFSPDPPPTVDPGVFEIRNQLTKPLGNFELVLRTRNVSISAVTSLATPTPVAGAVYNTYRGASTCKGTQAGSTPTDDGVTGTAMVPGTYCVAINKFDGTGNRDAFTAVLVINVPRVNKNIAPTTVTVVAPLPDLRPSLIGYLRAENTLVPATAVALVSATPVWMDAAFTEPVDISYNGSPTPNQNNPATDPATCAAGADPLPCGRARVQASPVQTTAPITDFRWSYTFTNVPYGANEITAPVVTGYSPSTARTKTVTIISDIGPTFVEDFVYTLSSKSVEVTLGPGVFPSLDADFPNDTTSVTLTPPTGSPYTTYSLTDFAGSPNTIVFTNVAPANGAFTLTFDDALHAGYTKSFPINVTTNARGNFVGTIPTNPVPDRVRLTGTARQKFGPDAANVSDLQTGAKITLTQGAKTYTLGPAPTVSSPGTWLNAEKFAIDVETAGSYALSVTQTGYEPLVNPAQSLPTLGTIVPTDLVINKTAEVTVTTTSDGLANPVGFAVNLINTANNNVYSPTSSPSVGTYIFRVPGGSTYQARARGTNYPDQFSTTTAVPIGAGTSTAFPVSVSLPRYARVSVTGVSPTSTNVTVDPAGTATTTAAASTTFEFVSPAVAPTGTISTTVSAPGYRTRVVDIPAAIVNDPPFSVAMLGNVTVSGTIDAVNGIDVITATAPGMTALKGSVSGGQYTVSGLGVGAGGESKVWTLTYDVVGDGHASAVLPEVTQTSTAALTQNLVLIRDDIDFNFTVTPSGASAGGAQIRIENAGGSPLATGSTPVDDTTTTPTDEATGLQTLKVKEHLKPTKWIVSHPNFLTKSGTITAITSRTARPVTVSLHDAVVGTVKDGATDVSGAVVTICPAAAAAPCAGGDIVATAAMPGLQFKFNNELPASTSYSVWAVSGAKKGSTTLTVNASGAATLGASSIAIT